MTTAPPKTPYTLQGEQGTTIWSDHEIVASIAESRSHPRRARKTAEFIVRACNRDHLFDDLVRALAIARSSIELLQTDSVIQIGPKPVGMINRILNEAKKFST